MKRLANVLFLSLVFIGLVLGACSSTDSLNEINLETQLTDPPTGGEGDKGNNPPPPIP